MAISKPNHSHLASRAPLLIVPLLLATLLFEHSDAREVLPPETRYALRIMRAQAKARARVRRTQYARYGRVLPMYSSCQSTRQGRYTTAQMGQAALEQMYLAKLRQRKDRVPALRKEAQ